MNIRETDDRGVVRVHLPHNYTATGAYHTLCGLCDVPDTIEDTQDPVDCDGCMAVLDIVLTLAAERGVIRSVPRKSTQDRARIAPVADDDFEDDE